MLSDSFTGLLIVAISSQQNAVISTGGGALAAVDERLRISFCSAVAF
jgi:hypothetical protein